MDRPKIKQLVNSEVSENIILAFHLSIGVKLLPYFIRVARTKYYNLFSEVDSIEGIKAKIETCAICNLLDFLIDFAQETLDKQQQNNQLELWQS